jgi:hypothetical protein
MIEVSQYLRWSKDMDGHGFPYGRDRADMDCAAVWLPIESHPRQGVGAVVSFQCTQGHQLPI